MLKKANGKVDGFVVEGPTAGGHNAPPRGKLQLNEANEPIYGERDRVDLAKMRELGLPFWLAGGYGAAEMLREALAAGAAGVQVGTAFAFCAESGLRDDYKQALLNKAMSGEAEIFTDPLASPTSFPFKVAQLEGTNSEREVYLARPRICDLGFLREAYRTAAGAIDYRCAGGAGDGICVQGRKCGGDGGPKVPLQRAVGEHRTSSGTRSGKYVEKGLVTSGDDLTGMQYLLAAKQVGLQCRGRDCKTLQRMIL